jgi:hypothetical protein
MFKSSHENYFMFLRMGVLFIIIYFFLITIKNFFYYILGCPGFVGVMTLKSWGENRENRELARIYIILAKTNFIIILIIIFDHVLSELTNKI